MAGLLLTVLLGLIIGGCLNAVIHRLPRRESLWGCPRCPHCRRILKPAELVPLLSFIALKGRCRGCGERVSWRYPAVELLSALLAAGLYLRFGDWRQSVVYGFLAAVLVAATFIDLEHRIIPNPLVLAGLLGGALMAPLWGGVPFLQAWAGFGLAGGIMLVIAVIARGGMGMGDVKLAAVLGLFLGPKLAALALLLAFWLGGLTGGLLLLLRRKGRKDMIPFGPFIGAGGMAAVFLGKDVLAWYLAAQVSLN